jgi:hypothetical protein
MECKSAVSSLLNRASLILTCDRFQYVALQLKALENAKSLNAVKQALQNLPAGLDQTYTRALLNIDPSQKSQAVCALKWLAFSERPITLKELAEASNIDPKTSPPFDKERRLFHPRAVLVSPPSQSIIPFFISVS